MHNQTLHINFDSITSIDHIWWFCALVRTQAHFNVICFIKLKSIWMGGARATAYKTHSVHRHKQWAKRANKTPDKRPKNSSNSLLTHRFCCDVLPIICNENIATFRRGQPMNSGDAASTILCHFLSKHKHTSQTMVLGQRVAGRRCHLPIDIM